MKRRTNPWPAFVDLFAALLIATFAGLIMFSGAFQNIRTKYNVVTKEQEGKGNIVVLDQFIFDTADFREYPYLELQNPEKTNEKVSGIVNLFTQQYPEHYIFIIGHSSTVDAKNPDRRISRQERNWNYAGGRAAKIADLIHQQLKTRYPEIDFNKWKDRIIVLSTGEFDLKIPSKPDDLGNAHVEVFFVKEWSIPAARSRNSANAQAKGPIAQASVPTPSGE